MHPKQMGAYHTLEKRYEIKILFDFDNITKGNTKDHNTNNL